MAVFKISLFAVAIVVILVTSTNLAFATMEPNVSNKRLSSSVLGINSILLLLSFIYIVLFFTKVRVGVEN